MRKPHGAFAEYGLSHAALTSHLPPNISFESAATIPLAALTAVNGFSKLGYGLPTALNPSDGQGESLPFLVYGASSAVGAFTIQLAKLAGIHPIIGVAGSGGGLAKEVGVDILIDRREGKVVEDIKAALGGKELKFVYDAISEGDSILNIKELLKDTGTRGAVVTHVLPVEGGAYGGEGVKAVRTMVGDSHDGTDVEKDLAYTYMRLFSRWLADGRFVPHPYEVVPGGLDGVEDGLRRLQSGEVSAKKLVFRISETKQ
jgi:NADPH2:quinone reductase